MTKSTCRERTTQPLENVRSPKLYSKIFLDYNEQETATMTIHGILTHEIP